MCIAFLFPGQGSQRSGMLHELPDHPIITETIEEASMVLHEDILSLDTGTALASTRAVQLALLVYGVALARWFKAYELEADMVAGHSVGAFAAAVVSGAMIFSDVISVVELRGRLMQNIYPSGYGMGVIIGLDEIRVTQLTEKVNSKKSPVYIANLNAIDQITIAGSVLAIEKVFALANSVGVCSTRMIRVSVPSHCKLLDRVSYEVSKKMEHITLRNPNIPYVGNCRARILKSGMEIREDLSMGVANPVRWHEATSLMYERGAGLFIELGTGEVLTNLAKKAFPDARCISIVNSGYESALFILKREKMTEQQRSKEL